MWKSNISCVFVIATLALFATSVEALNLPALKTAYNNFFSSLESVSGKPNVIVVAREAYNTCAQQAATYNALITCARTAYNVYDPILQTKVNEKYEAIMTLHTQFTHAILLATQNDPPALQNIPIPGYQALAGTAMRLQARAMGHPVPE